MNMPKHVMTMNVNYVLYRVDQLPTQKQPRFLPIATNKKSFNIEIDEEDSLKAIDISKDKLECLAENSIQSRMSDLIMEHQKSIAQTQKESTNLEK